ncbi:MAG: hypothetical protein RDV48_28650 [Candidatus Eremiobacteraeota bacterium]|nr:hypothetical protein [Candidatus Eremiobacteraeota bacterium]
MAGFGLDFKSFFDDYFRRNDEKFLAELGEVINERDDSREIAALADWSFRNYVIEALVKALEANNEKIYRDFADLLSGIEPPQRHEPALYQEPQRYEESAPPGTGYPKRASSSIPGGVPGGVAGSGYAGRFSYGSPGGTSMGGYSGGSPGTMPGSFPGMGQAPSGGADESQGNGAPQPPVDFNFEA